MMLSSLHTGIGRSRGSKQSEHKHYCIGAGDTKVHGCAMPETTFLVVKTYMKRLAKLLEKPALAMTRHNRGLRLVCGAPWIEHGD